MKRLLVLFLFFPIFNNNLTEAFQEKTVDINMNSKIFLDYINENNLNVKKACAGEVCIQFDESSEKALKQLAEKYYEHIKEIVSEDDYYNLYYKGFVINKIIITE